MTKANDIASLRGVSETNDVAIQKVNNKMNVKVGGPTPPPTSSKSKTVGLDLNSFEGQSHSFHLSSTVSFVKLNIYVSKNE